MWQKFKDFWKSFEPPPAKKILLVDDEEDLLTELKAFLEEEGYEVLTAQDGETALKIVAETKPDLILLDLNIPKLSGFQILEAIKPKESGMKVLIFSGVATTADKERAVALGVLDCLNKPIYIKALLQEIEKAVGEKG